MRYIFFSSLQWINGGLLYKLDLEILLSSLLLQTYGIQEKDVLPLLRIMGHFVKQA